MHPDKHLKPKLLFRENSFTPLADDDPDWPAAGQNRLRMMISRAVLVYGILFMGCGVLMSALGLSPLANNGIMPKTLLVFVGLSFIIALCNNFLVLSRDYGLSMSSLAHSIIRAALKRSKRGD
jgi:hypothetical protein